MKLTSCLLAIAVGWASWNAKADSKEDAATIADMLVTDEAMSAALDSMRPIVKRAFSAPFGEGEQARTFSEAEQRALVDAIYDEFSADFVNEMRKRTAKIYAEMLSPAALAATVRSMASEEGAEFFRAQPDVIRRSSEAGKVAGTEIGQTVFPRVLQRIVDEGSSLFKPTEIEALEQMLLQSGGAPDGKPSIK
ncbi:MAG: hypothetical protein AB8B85_07420 [Paracoccaceae bacterium]